MPNHTPEEGWEERFDNQFNIPHWKETGYNLNKVKDFIARLLKEQLEEVKTKISLSPKTQLDETENADTYEEGYEQCLDDVLSLLEDKP